MDRRALVSYFSESPLLVELCMRGGWPDPDTLRVEVVDRQPDSAMCNLRFEEVVVEAAGSCADRIECWGQCRVDLDERGRIRNVAVVAGPRD